LNWLFAPGDEIPETAVVVHGEHQRICSARLKALLEAARHARGELRLIAVAVARVVDDLRVRGIRPASLTD